MFLGYQNGKIKFYTEAELEKDLYNLDRVEKTQAEYVIDGDEYVLKDENWFQKQTLKRQTEFEKDFFNTSLGYIRRKVSMKTGEIKDFLTDLLPVISMGVSSGQQVDIITYQLPNFTKEITDWTELQTVKQATPQFVQECFIQLSNDFNGGTNA